MDAAVGRDRFWELFKGRALVVSELPAGHSRVLAKMANDTADHVVPLARGGGSERTNLRRAHARCNALRNALRSA